MSTSKGCAVWRRTWQLNFQVEEKGAEQVGQINLMGQSLTQCLFIKLSVLSLFPHPLSHRKGNKSGLLRNGESGSDTSRDEDIVQ